MLAPEQIIERLEQIDEDLAVRQNDLEAAAEKWFKAKRDREQRHAEVFIKTAGPMAIRKATADHETATDGRDEEAAYEAVKAVVRVLETRASIGQTLARTNARTAS